MTSISFSPDQVFGDLFRQVQQRRLFDDNKTFPDMEPLRPPAEIMAAWQAEQPQDDDAIRAFVARHFAPPLGAEIRVDAQGLSMPDYIRLLWDALSIEPAAIGPWSSALSLPERYIIPGGRFREIYYWDAYFTMLGLRVDGRDQAIEWMLDNFVSVIERFGHIPNGLRSYYLSRSQPPFFALMLGLSRAAPSERRMQALRHEYDYWMRGAADLSAPGASEHVVRLPDGTTLNRYWDAADTPRPESYAEDLETAAHSDRPAQQLYRDLRAGCESGWDFSSRWFADGRTLATIEASAILPVDLNALLYLAERRLGLDAEPRAEAIRRTCWLEGEGRFADWHWREGRAMPGVTAATLYPLFAGVATEAQAARVAETVRDSLLAPGGLRTTNVRSGQQWDAPNGWAPLQWVGIVGLRRYGHDALADTIAGRWLETVEQSYAQLGVLLEKYDVEDRLPAAGGEYHNQEGFGWTNGVAQALLNGADRNPAFLP